MNTKKGARFALISLALAISSCDDDPQFSINQDSENATDIGQSTEPDTVTSSGTESGTTPNDDFFLSECQDGADCQLVNDCCNCMAIRSDQAAPDCPPTPCFAPACSALSLGANTVNCVAGRCVLGVSCDDRNVTCKMAEPVCAKGEEPVVNESGNCWAGPCLEASQCMVLPSCDSCRSGHVCVTYQSREMPTYHCATNRQDCLNDVTCDCLGESVCISPFFGCMDSPGGISCSCPAC